MPLILETLQRWKESASKRPLSEKLYPLEDLLGEVEAWDSPEAFARRYLAHYLTAPSAPFHKELYRLMTSREPNKREAIAAPRGHGKSVLMSLVFPLWALATRRKRFILIISSTSNIAEGFLASIIRELEENPLLRRDFGDLVGREKWTDREILTSTGVRVCARGTNSSLRGMRSFQSRPDLIICDDIEDEEAVQSAEQRQKLESWFYGSVLNLPGPQGDAFVIGTVLHHDSLLGKLLRKWKGLRYQAISQDGSVLWPNYYDREHLEKIRQGDGEKEGIGTIAFQAEYQNNPISPEEQLIREEWVRYYRREDIEGQALHSSCGATEGQELLIVTALDPALGGGGGGDYSALVTVGHSPKADGRIYVLEADIAHRTPKATLEMAIRNFKRWSSIVRREGVYPPPITEGHKGPPYERRDVASEQNRDRSLDLSEDVAGGMGASPLSPSPLSPEDGPGAAHRPASGGMGEGRVGVGHFLCLAIETNAFQVILKDMLEEMSRRQGLFIPVRAVKNYADKTARIASLSPLVENGTILFLKEQRQLIEQLIEFPKGAHDDGPDALEMAVRQLRRHGEPRIRFV